MSSLEKYFNYFSNIPFPVYKLSEDNIKKLYNNLKKAQCNSATTNCAIDIVTSSHPSIWKCNVQRYKSPYTAWNTPELLYKAIENRLSYIGKTITDRDIVRAFSVAKIAPKISLFRPGLAKYLVNKYLSKYGQIFDPCAGFSGRMLGVCSTGKKYIGQDVNSTTIKESIELKNILELDTELSVKNSLYETGTYECLFTCPPYMKNGKMLEIWNQDIEPASEDEWIDTCLKNYDCKEYLFVISNTDKYKDYIVETITNKSHFSSGKEYVVLIKRD